MVKEFKLGDRVLYKGIGGRRNLKGTISGVFRNKKGKAINYSIKLDKPHGLLGSWLSCPAEQLSELGE